MIPHRANLLRSLIEAHVRRAISAGMLRGVVLNLSAGSIDYRELIEGQPGTRMVATDWPRSPTSVKVDVYCDAAAIPFAPRCFDSAMCTEVLEHLPDPSRTVRELARVLRPGGWLLVTTPFAYQAHQRPYDFFRFTDIALREMFRAAGFVDVSVRRSGDSLAVLLHALKMQRWRGTTRLLRAADRGYLRFRAERAVSEDTASDPWALGYCVTGRTPPRA
jgi:SAM-dependent methyltransferase